jgi:hypothetical protein
VNDPRPAELQRLRHVPGQLLRSRDFRDQLANDDQLRWWHNRAVHDAVGVAAGLEVTLAADQQSVLVGQGVAYDRFGRALRLLRPRRLPLPAGAEPLTLLARAPSQAPGGCVPGAAPHVEAELAWRATGPTGPSDGVALAILEFPPEGPRLVPVRRSRPLARPRLGYGATPAAATPWELWPVGDDLFGLQVRIDTATAGFTEVPCYFAWLQWPRVGGTRGLPPLLYQLVGLQYLEEPAVDRFVFRVVVPLSRTLDGEGVGDGLLGFARGQQLSVCWLGVQDDLGPAGPPDDEGQGDGRLG